MLKQAWSKTVNMDYHVSLNVILRNKQGEVLLLKMPDNSSMVGYYDFPGGRIKQDEVNVS